MEVITGANLSKKFLPKTGAKEIAKKKVNPLKKMDLPMFWVM
jgi:hypothetical protein